MISLSFVDILHLVTSRYFDIVHIVKFYFFDSCLNFRLVKGAWQEGPSLNEARERAFMIQIHTTSRSFLWIGGSFGSVSTETLDDQDTVWKTSVSFPDSWKTFGICAVEINQDNILVSPTNMAESKVLIVSEMKLVEGPAPSLSGKENSVCGRIRTKPYSLERSLVRIVAQTKFIEFLDVGLGNWDPKMVPFDIFVTKRM